MALSDVLALRGAAGTAATPIETFDAFAARTLDSSYRIASMIVGDAADAEEATHDAYLAAAKRWRRVRDPEGRDAWFGRLLIKACRARARGRRRVRVVDISDQLVAERYHVEGAVRETGIDREALARAFSRLGMDHRICLVLRYGAEFEVARIAGWTGTSERTVTSRLREGLRAVGVAVPTEAVEAARIAA